MAQKWRPDLRTFSANFFDWKSGSANFFAFRMYANQVSSCVANNHSPGQGRSYSVAQQDKIWKIQIPSMCWSLHPSTVWSSSRWSGRELWPASCQTGDNHVQLILFVPFASCRPGRSKASLTSKAKMNWSGQVERRYCSIFHQIDLFCHREPNVSISKEYKKVSSRGWLAS